MTHDEIQQQLIWAGKVLVAEGQDDFTRGHISFRLPDKPSLFFMKPHSLGLDEITLDPANTRTPCCTVISHSGPNSTSTRDPNLIRPTRSPFATRSPGCLLNTMRRAIRPAICLKTTQVPSPRTLTTFCSFSVEHSSRLAT